MLPVRITTFIVNALLGHMVDIGRNQYGTFFIQKLVTGKVKGQVSVQLLIEEEVSGLGLKELCQLQITQRCARQAISSKRSP